jgi:hypothetical protein
MYRIDIPLTATSDQHPKNRAIGEEVIDHERLRYVTRILGAQQGLFTMCLGTMFLFTEVGDIWDWQKGWLAALTALVGMEFCWRRIRLGSLGY